MQEEGEGELCPQPLALEKVQKSLEPASSICSRQNIKPLLRYCLTSCFQQPSQFANELQILQVSSVNGAGALERRIQTLLRK